MARHFSKAGFAAQHPPGLPLQRAHVQEARRVLPSGPLHRQHPQHSRPHGKRRLTPNRSYMIPHRYAGPTPDARRAPERGHRFLPRIEAGPAAA